MLEDGRSYAEQLPPDVSEGGDLPGGGGVEPVVVPGAEVDHHLIQGSASPRQPLAGS